MSGEGRWMNEFSSTDLDIAFPCFSHKALGLVMLRNISLCFAIYTYTNRSMIAQLVGNTNLFPNKLMGES